MRWKWKGQGREGGKKQARPHKVRYVKGRDKRFMIPAASSQRILGGNEMRSSYLYSRCKGLSRIAYYSRQSLSRSLNKRQSPELNSARKLNVRYVLKNPDTAKTQKREKPSSPTLKTGPQNSKKRKIQFSNTEGEGVAQRYS